MPLSMEISGKRVVTLCERPQLVMVVRKLADMFDEWVWARSFA